ncbi:MAG: trigger factor [Clostridiales bacterium]|nr:trigger factor [Clostridiales bacterium]
MKRKYFLTAMMCACVLAVGGSSAVVMAEEETEAASTEDAAEEEDSTEDETEAETEAERPTYNALDYVELGEYLGLSVEVEATEVTDEDVLAEANDLISYSDAVETLTEGTVQEGDTASISYVGTIDGEEFDGGSGDYDLEIGSGTFIDGFEEGLIGVEVGETVDLELTFPENYYEELAGQDVVFTVTVNGILSVPELSDEVVDTATDGEYTDVDSWLAYIREYLEEDAAEEEEYYIQEAILEALVANSSVNGYPEDVVAYSVNSAVDYYEYWAEAYSVEYEEFIVDYMGYESTESFEEALTASVESSLEEEMLLMAVADTEGLELSDEEYETGLAEYAEEYGYDSGEEMEADYGETEMRRYILLDKVFAFLEENAVIEVISEDETESETDLDAAEADTEADTDAEAETEADTEAETEAETEAADTEAEAETEAGTEAETEAETDAQTEG